MEDRVFCDIPGLKARFSCIEKTLDLEVSGNMAEKVITNMFSFETQDMELLTRGNGLLVGVVEEKPHICIRVSGRDGAFVISADFGKDEAIEAVRNIAFQFQQLGVDIMSEVAMNEGEGATKGATECPVEPGSPL